MDIPSHDHVTCPQGAKCGSRPAGFSLLEMMMVVTLIPCLRGGQVLIIASIATPICRSVVVRARAAAA